MRKRDREFMERQSSDLRDFIREQTLIANRRMDQFDKELREYRQAMHRHFDEQAAKLDEVIAEGRAGRAALFAMIDRLDRLDRGGGPATA